MWKITTTTGEFAIKQLNPHITAKSDFKQNYELSEKIRKYVVHYQVRKIKSELERNWKLKTVHGRGFNVSFKMSLEALSYEVFKRRKKYQDEVLKAKKDEAKRLALERLYGTQP
jgi:hypothetical protein